MMITALVLAAGAGSRIGQPKSRLLIDGVPLAILHARRAREAGCAKVMIVTRHADEGWVRREADVAVSEEPEQAGSLRVGVGTLSDDGEWALVTPVDALPVRVETIARLVGAVRSDLDAVTPVLAGAGGHPVLVRASVLRRAYSHAAPPLRDVLHELGARRLRVEVDDPNVVTNLDTPADVVAATGAEPAFFAPSSLHAD